jgi:hypothetical protein
MLWVKKNLEGKLSLVAGTKMTIIYAVPLPGPTTIGPEDWPKMVLTHVPDSGIGQSQS